MHSNIILVSGKLNLPKRVSLSLLFVTLFGLFTSCASTVRPFKLARLSTVTKEDHSNRAVTVFVNLKSKQPNQVAVFNWGTYDVFGVYKKQANDILFSRYATLFSGPKQDVSSTVVMFSDSLSSSLEDRYEVRPVVSGQELAALPIEYVTDDTAYYNWIEGKNSPR